MTIQDVRDWLLDRSAADNLLDCDLTFTDPEIVAAMRSAAREFNSIPPYIQNVSADCLPMDTNLFLDAVVYFLYNSKIANWARNAVTFEAGGVKASPDEDRMKRLIPLRDMHYERFRETAGTIKHYNNLRQSWGVVG